MGYPDAAGIIVLKLMGKEENPCTGFVFDGEYHLLVLHGLDGRLDIPKGVCDPGEDTLTAALRETEEEAGLTDLHFPLGHINKCFDSLYVYIALTKQDVVIKPNPISGITEHLGHEWLDLDTAKNADWSPYLEDAVCWAIQKVDKRL
tara:strand:+ start:315 stop:755 length:441 start_codon:yes stop_codon:yes gene_type:complete